MKLISLMVLVIFSYSSANALDAFCTKLINKGGVYLAGDVVRCQEAEEREQAAYERLSDADKAKADALQAQIDAWDRVIELGN